MLLKKMFFPMKFSLNIFIIIIIATTTAHAKGHKKTIFVVSSYHKEYRWDQSWTKGLRNNLDQDLKLIFFYMNTKQTPAEEHLISADKAMAMFKNLSPKPDLIILADDNALKYVGPRLINSGVNVVYMGINDNPRAYFDKLPSNFTGVLERPILKRSLILIKEINPSIKNALILFDDNTSSRAFNLGAHGFKKNKIMSFGGMQVHTKIVNTFSDWKKYVNKVGTDYDALFLTGYFSIFDDNGKHVDPNKVIKWTSKNSKLPTYCLWDYCVGKNKGVGGVVIFGESMGKAAATIAKEVLSGKRSAHATAISLTEGRYFFSRSELKRWKLTLPTNISNIKYVQ